MIKEYKEVHQTGNLEVTFSSLPKSTGLLKELQQFLMAETDGQPFSVPKCDVGVQIATDGRIWICVDGAAFLRFKPSFKETKV